MEYMNKEERNNKVIKVMKNYPEIMLRENEPFG